jgi:phosphohistidine phosphatase SixA
MGAMKRRHIVIHSWAAAIGLMAWHTPRGAQAASLSATPPAAGDGRVLLLRHARAPGTFDPPGFQLGDCSTQRNLSAEGQAQARAIGQWFAQHGPAVVTVRSSPWCRCMDTARLAFGRAEAWADLGSPVDLPASQQQRQITALRAALQAVTAQGGLHVWVTHMFVQQDLTGQSTAAGEGLMIQASPDGTPRVLAPWAVRDPA